jgi:hypothetical protein
MIERSYRTCPHAAMQRQPAWVNANRSQPAGTSHLLFSLILRNIAKRVAAN